MNRLLGTQSFERCKKMDQNRRRDKFEKAKIEELNLNRHLRLPKDLFPTPDSDLCYVKIFGLMDNLVQCTRDFSCENIQKAQQGGGRVALGLKLDRKVYRIRNKDLITVIGDDFGRMNGIQRSSKATIGILADAESNLLSHSFLDLVGTIEQVQIAEELILDEVLKTYSNLISPVILMPPVIYRSDITIPLHKVNQVLGNYSINLLKMEMESRAWIKIEQDPSSLDSELRVVNICGPQENINKAKLLIQAVISSKNEELSAAGDASDKMVDQFKEPSCVEIIDVKSDVEEGSDSS